MSVPARKVVALLGVAVVALTAAACGGGSSASSALSAADLRTQADAICKTSDDAIAALGEPKTADDLKTFFPKALDSAKTQLADLKKLSAPDELKSEWDSAIVLVSKQYDTLAAAGAKIAGGADPIATITAASTEANANEDALKTKAKALGLTVCGKDDSSSASSGSETTGTDTTATTDGATSTTGSALGVADAAAFSTDTTAFGTALQGWGTLVTTITSGSAITENIDALRADTDKAEAALSKMDGYTIKDATLEAKRSALVSKGRDLTTLMREFENDGPTNSDSKMADLVSRFQTAVRDFTTEFGS